MHLLLNMLVLVQEHWQDYIPWLHTIIEALNGIFDFQRPIQQETKKAGRHPGFLHLHLHGLSEVVDAVKSPVNFSSLVATGDILLPVLLHARSPGFFGIQDVNSG